MVGDCCAFILLQRLQVSPLTVVIRFSVLVVLTPIIIVVLLFYRTQRVKIKWGGGYQHFLSTLKLNPQLDLQSEEIFL